MMAGRTWRRGRPGSGRRRRWPSRSTSCSSTRPGRSHSRTSSRSPARRRTSSCSATRSNSTSHSRARTRRAPIGRRWRTSSAIGHDAADAGPVPREHLAAASRPVRLHVRGVLRRPARAASRSRDATNRPASHARRRPASSTCRRTEGADNESPVEADAVAELARDIVDGSSTWTDATGDGQPVGWEDVLIVAPYNAQVGAIRRRLPPEARVGTVDKFQGQEAPVSIYSMTTSSPELAPRGMDFLYSRHRLNVATSRARCVTIVVASPDLLRVQARTPNRCAWRTHSVASRSWLDRRTDTRPTTPWRPGYARGRARCATRSPGQPPRALRRRTVGSLVAGVALGSTGHIAAVTVATIVANDLSGSALLSGAPGAAVVLGAALGATLLSRLMVVRGRRIGSGDRVRDRSRSARSSPRSRSSPARSRSCSSGP